MLILFKKINLLVRCKTRFKLRACMWWPFNILISRFAQTLSTVVFFLVHACVQMLHKHEPTRVENIGDNIESGVILDDCIICL